MWAQHTRLTNNDFTRQISRTLLTVKNQDFATALRATNKTEHTVCITKNVSQLTSQRGECFELKAMKIVTLDYTSLTSIKNIKNF